ncbi:MAG: ribosomal protein S18-alanine N-acetyltransferase [Desulfobulbus sp.]|nr:ribosomal protein S18-alanine N-acetyltransferase [Desulfobulbus sp.]
MQSEWSEIRPVRASDLAVILGIEQAAMPAPWNENQLLAELAAENGHGWVAEEKDGPIAYAFFRTCLPECELLHLVVVPGKRRQGLAEGLLQKALMALVAAGCTSCLLEVRDSNTAARQLYAKMGFSQVGRRKKYYRQPIEDALLMHRDLIESNKVGA